MFIIFVHLQGNTTPNKSRYRKGLHPLLAVEVIMVIFYVLLPIFYVMKINFDVCIIYEIKPKYLRS